MNIGDGKNDGIFQIRKGDGLSQAIVSELGLSAEQVKKLGKSVWNQIFEQIDNAIEEPDSEGLAKDEKYGYKVSVNQVIKVSQKYWSQITNIVNNALKTDIKTDFAEEEENPNQPQAKKNVTQKGAYLQTNFNKIPQGEGMMTRNFPSNWNSDGTPPARINLADYTYENIKKNYPESEYDIVNYPDGIIDVRQKNTQELVFEVYDDGDEIWIFEGDGQFNRFYSKEGNLISYEDENGEHPLIPKKYWSLDDTEKAEKMHAALNARQFGLGTNKDDIEEIIKECLAVRNVYDVLNSYSKKFGENLISSIIHDYNLDAGKRSECIKFIKSALEDRYNKSWSGDEADMFKDIFSELDLEIGYQNYKTVFSKGELLDTLINQLERRVDGKLYFNTGIQDVANGKIDKDFAQQNTGDCWLVAAIKSITSNPKTKEMLENQISVDEKGNVTVNLKGVNKTYTFTSEELKSARELSGGDMDVRAIEMAVNKYFHETNAHSKENIGRDINYGNRVREAFRIILGKNCDTLYDDKINDELIDKIKTGNYICSANVSSDKKELKNAVDKNDDAVNIIKNHAYSVIDSDENYVYIVNPWDTSNILKMTHDDFKNTFNWVYLLDVSELA